MQGKLIISPRATLRLFTLLLAALFIPYLILCFHSHPVADDFSYGSAFSFWNGQLQLYQHWNGRYSANFMMMANPIRAYSLTGYRFSALLLLGFLPISLYILVGILVENVISSLSKLYIAFIVSVLILGLLPSLPEGIYWYPGSMTYILGCIMAMLYAGTAFSYYKKKFFINSIIHFVACVILLFLAVGFNEVQMFILVFGHFLLWLTVKKEEKFKSFGFAMLFLCIVFSTIVFFSPGNHFREGYFPNNHHFVNSFFMTCLQMVRFFFLWVSFAPLLIASILFIPVSYKMTKYSVLFMKLGTFNPFIMFSILWIILFLCIFPAYWSTAILGQHRTLNTACFYFVPAWFLFIHSVCSHNSLSEKIQSIINPKVQVVLTLFLAASLLFSGNSGTAIMELATGKILAFDKEMNNRYKLMDEAKKKGVKNILLPALEDKPISLFVLDIQPGCNHWINQEQAHFFGLENICCDSIKVSGSK